MAKGQKGPIVTKKHLARQERERIQNRYILIASIAVIVLVVGLIGFGIVQQYIIQPNQPVAKVGNKSITTRQFQTFARYERLQLIQQYQQYQQFAQLFGSDQNSLQYIQQYLSQISYQLQPANVGQAALDYLIADQVIQKEAAKDGITVTDQEVDKALQDYFGFFPNGTPTTAPTSVPVPTSTLNPTQLFLVPPTSTPTASPTPTVALTPTITATQIIASPTPTIVTTPTAIQPTGTPLPTSTPYTQQLYQKELKNYMSNIHSFAALSEADYRWIFRMQLLRQKVYDAVTKDVSRQQDEVWVRHITTTDQAKAQDAYNRVTSGGENFDTVATEVISGTSNTVDLGWLGVGALDTNAAKVVFNMQIGQISEPINTATGWEVYQLLGHEVRTLSDSQFEQLRQTNFQTWIDAQRTAENAQTFDLWKTRVPISPTIPPTQPGQ
jgi:SurA-like N-terminal domain/PPIC-type PPIASE domain